MLKLIVFDWDGTLADSVGKIIECKIFLAKKYNLPVPTEETIKNVLGIKFEDAMLKCFPNASPNLLNKLGKEFHDLMQQENYQATLFPNVKEVLKLLKKRGIMLALAIATSKDRHELNRAIEYNRLSDLFDVTCCGAEHQNKPAPTMLNYIMDEFNVKPNECVMIGDTTTDIQFAANAGIKTICVTFGAHSVEKLQSMTPLAFMDEWKQLPEIINKL